MNYKMKSLSEGFNLRGEFYRGMLFVRLRVTLRVSCCAFGDACSLGKYRK